MSERFDTLFAGMSEESALDLIQQDPSELDNPGLKYLAASRLGACSSKESLQTLINVAWSTNDNLFERITRRKALEALGRRKDATAIPALVHALDDSDEPTVVNAADAITRINAPLDEQQQSALLGALNGPDNQRRAVIQTFTRLQLVDRGDAISRCQHDSNPLVAGAARAYSIRVLHKLDGLDALLGQLTDENPGRRRAAVIDLGDAREIEALPALIRCPVSMPLRAKSAFQISSDPSGDILSRSTALLEQLLMDDPRQLHLDGIADTASTPEAIRADLQHRDEARQYSAARALMTLAPEQQLNLIDDLRTSLGSDYGVHYLLANCTGLLGLTQRADLVRDALAETGPQYAKSRIAAAWSCLHLSLSDQRDLINELSCSHGWLPLRWSCAQVLKKMN